MATEEKTVHKLYNPMTFEVPIQEAFKILNRTDPYAATTVSNGRILEKKISTRRMRYNSPGTEQNFPEGAEGITYMYFPNT